MNRAEMRRRKKEMRKQGVTLFPIADPTNYSTQQMAEKIGVNVRHLDSWAQQKEAEIRKEMAEEGQMRLERAEDCVAIINAMVSILAINKAWGFDKEIVLFMKHYSDALRYVESHPLKETYDLICEMTGMQIDLQERDLNEIFYFLNGARELKDEEENEEENKEESDEAV